jgi:hypothetical protein
MYSMFSSREILNVWKVNYCEAAYETCARYQLSWGSLSVPQTLLPNGKHLKVESVIRHRTTKR